MWKKCRSVWCATSSARRWGSRLMRIVGGTHRGRALEAPEGKDIRPTTDRVRETLFNLIAHANWSPGLHEVRVLDAFCGSGALALEALSRGASHATLMDSAAPSLALARRNAETLGLAARCSFIRGSAAEPPPTSQPADLLFLDPPYRKGLLEAALPALARQGWAAPAAVALCETASDETLSLPGLGWKLVDRRKYGATTLWVLELTPAAGA